MLDFYKLMMTVFGHLSSEMKFSASVNVTSVLYYFPKERPGALIRIRLKLGESAKT